MLQRPSAHSAAAATGTHDGASMDGFPGVSVGNPVQVKGERPARPTVLT